MKRTALAPLPLMQFIPAASPKLESPLHLAPLVEVLEETERGEVLVVCATHPRAGKTETIKHAIARRLRMRPDTRVGFATYSAALAGKKSREIRELYKRVGGRVAEDASSRADWRTGVGDGGLWAGGVGGSWTGEGFDLFVIDDPVKDRATAESALERDNLWEWFTDVGYTRLEPGGSCVVNATRWHHDDLSGRLLADDWRRVHLPAIDSRGRALWPARFPIAKLRQIQEQIGDYAWASLYQGEPYPRGGAVFRDTYFYDAEPAGRLRVRIGLDFAYTAKRRSDYSVAVVMAEHGGKYFVLEVLRQQCTAPEFIRRIGALQERYSGARLCVYYGGTERAQIDTMKEMGLIVDARPATEDKFTRAQPCAAAWNRGDILLPRKSTWLDSFVSEIVSFTGVNDRHDDQVDALAAAFVASASSAHRIKPGQYLGGTGECDRDAMTVGGWIDPWHVHKTDFFAK